MSEKTERWFILVNIGSCSRLYNTGICSWHSLKGQSTKNRIHIRHPYMIITAASSVCRRIFFLFLIFFSFFLLNKPPKNEKSFLGHGTKRKEENKQRKPKRHLKPRQTDVSPTTENYTDMQLTSIYTELYRHAKTTLL